MLIELSNSLSFVSSSISSSSISLFFLTWLKPYIAAPAAPPIAATPPIVFKTDLALLLLLTSFGLFIVLIGGSIGPISGSASGMSISSSYGISISGSSINSGSVGISISGSYTGISISGSEGISTSVFSIVSTGDLISVSVVVVVVTIVPAAPPPNIAAIACDQS